MSLSGWIKELAETGRVRVPILEPFESADLSAAQQAVVELDSQIRLNLPSKAPELNLACALWAARLMYHACQFLVHRDIGEDVVKAVLEAPAPAEPSPWAYYSSDLFLRHLPELVSMARGMAESDPLVLGLMGLCRAWPLSSVGVRSVGEVDVSNIVNDPCVRGMYADRIIEHADSDRLRDPRVAEAVREAMGGVPSLMPESLVRVLSSIESP